MRCTPAETKSVGRNGRCSFPLQTNDSESRYVPCQRRGEEDGGGRTRRGEVTLRRKDSLSMQKNVVNTTRAGSGCRSSTWGRTASSFPDTSRHCEREREKEAGWCNGNVAVKVPPSLYPKFFPLSYYNSPSPIPHTNIHRPTGSRVAAKKGLCRRGRAAGTLAPPAAAASHICRRHATWPLSALFSSFCVGLQI